MTTLVVIKHAQVGSRHFQHLEQLPPGLLPREVIDHWLDEGWLRECEAADCRSLYRLLHRFSGAKEQEPLTKAEKEALCLE
jgi:hypothetical protein